MSPEELDEAITEGLRDRGLWTPPEVDRAGSLNLRRSVMTPTNEQIIAEARRRAKEQNWRMDIEDYIIEVMREGWTPPEPVVDPDVLAFREWVNRHGLYDHNVVEADTNAGKYDSRCEAKAYLAGARMAREQERERAKVLVECVERYAGPHAAMAIAKYRGEA